MISKRLFLSEKNTTLRWRRKSSQKNPETDFG